MDAIFKALNDPSRRALLDALRAEDGQTLTQLVGQLDMTRFGVAKHLGLLEDAHLITTVKRGRFKYHYLNAVPLQELIDRWIEPLLAAPAGRGIIDLKTQLEKDHAMLDTDTNKPDFVLQTFIKCTQDALWDALTDPEQMTAYHFLSHDVSKDGETYTYKFPSGDPMLVCKTLSSEPKSRIEATFEPRWEGGGEPSRVIYRLDPEGDTMRLTLEHYALTFPVVAGEGVADGWARWAAGLKTWLETGDAVRFSSEASE